MKTSLIEIRRQSYRYRSIPRSALLAAAAALLLALAAPLTAAVHPNHVQGFAPEKLYQMDGIENVSLFNGNLNLTIPLGGSYPVGGSLSYGLTLVYSGNPWEWEEIDVNGPEGTETYLKAIARKRSNAGLGWLLSLGRLDPPRPEYPQPLNAEYESPDGAVHELFAGGLHGEGGAGDGRAYSQDGTYLRHHPTARTIESPDGTKRTFDATKRLTRIEDRFGNALNVTYPASAAYSGVSDWLLQDTQGRSHRIFFKPAVYLGTVVEKVELAAFNGTKATYTFQYTDATIARGFTNPNAILNYPTEFPSRETVPLLTGLVLPDGSSYQMAVGDYDPGPAHPNTSNLSGSLLRMKLPTGGRMEWDWTPYIFPVASGNSVGLRDLYLVQAPQKNPFTSSAGLAARRHKNASGGLLGSWSYQQVIDSATAELDRRVIVTDPLLHPSTYYFSVYSERVMPQTGWPPGGWTWTEYGLPFTRAQSDGTSPGRFLSAELKKAGGAVQRKVYVRYERDGEFTSANARLASERTVYVDDGGTFAETNSSDYDGLGHYRRVTTGGNFGAGNVRETYTSFNPGSCATCTPATSTPWVLGTYTFQHVTEGGVTSRTEACFEATGFLLRTRTLKSGTTQGLNDLVTRFSRDASGNVTAEESFGGDTQSVAGGWLCGLALPAAQYRVDHTYQYGGLKSSQYAGQSFKSADFDRDFATGLVKTSRDVSGLATNFAYDELGRPTWVNLAQASYTVHVYSVPSVTTPAKVWIYRKPNGGSGAPLTTDELHFDPFGRLAVERRTMADGTVSERKTFYDAAGNVDSKTEWGTTASTSYLFYDPFGRPGTIRPPDGSAHDVSLTYKGVRQVNRTVKVGTAWNGTAVTETAVMTTEIYDRQGRLSKVVEPANPDGTSSTTTYSYDVGQRLRQVDQAAETTAGATVTQTRLFTYDHRGFLTSERHPEKGASGNGTVSYFNYDARGHAGRVIDGPSDLTFTWDGAERLTRIRETGGGFSSCQATWTSGPRCLKEFTYATSNGIGDWRLGKLQLAKRYNYPVLGTTTYTAAINQLYTYGGKQGRVSGRDTSMTFNGGTTERFLQSWTWNDLGDVASIGYPQCAFAQYCTQTVPRTITSTYANGFLTAVPGYASSITYHPNGQINLVTRANGVVDTYYKDLQNLPRPRQIDAWKGATQIWNSGLYSFDGAGNVTKTGSSYFLYDRVSRVASGSVYTGAHGGAAGPRPFSHTFDGFGNLQALTTVTPRNTPTSSTTNRLTGSVLYDAAGNLTYWNGNTYQYDRLGQMVRMAAGSEIWLYMYDADDERVWAFKESAAPSRFDRWTLRDLDGKVLRTYEATNFVWSWSEDHLYRGSTLLASVTPGGVTTQLHTDHLGTVRAATNSAGTRTAYHAYYPFGEEATSITQDTQRMKFTGHERDLGNLSSAADDLDYMHARFYNPQTGRFLSFDPKARRGSTTRAQSWNRYAYALGNPLKFSDPDGRDVTYSNPDDQKFYERAAVRNWRVRAVLDAFAPGTGRNLAINRGNPPPHPTTGVPQAAQTTLYTREATPEELQKAYATAASQGGDQAGTAAAQALVDEGQQLREATIILSNQASGHEKLHELGHVERGLLDPEAAIREGEEANNAKTDEDYKKSRSEEYAEEFATDAKKKRPSPP